VVGDLLDSALDMSRAAAAGSILLDPRSYLHLEHRLASRVPGAVVVTERTGDDVTCASVTFPPLRGTQGSTFAPLGMC
jgi:hypothetical protein